jgi:site-specific DNA recombinase
MKSAAIYARVSTEEQTHGTSLDSQLDECRKYAREHNYTVVQEIQESRSGAYLARPGLDRLRDMAQRKEISALIVAEQDRLSRTTAHTYLLLDEFESAHVQVIFVREPMEDTPEGKMFFGIRATFKEWERAKIRERMRRGKEKRTTEGKVLGSWAVPYGYRYVAGEGCYKVIDEEAAWVVRAFKWLVEEHCSLGEIARRLTGRAPNKRGASYWHRSTVKSMLTNSGYSGVWYWNKTEQIMAKNPRTSPHAKKKPKTSQAARPQEEWLAVPIPAIITPELFEQAARQLKEGAVSPMRLTTRQYLLRGMLFCKQCKRRLVGHSQGVGGKYLNYRCPGRSVPDLQDNCRCKYLNARKADAEVWEKVLARLRDRRYMTNILKESEQTWDTDRRRDDAELAGYFKREEELRRESDRWLDAYSRESIDADVLRARMASVKERQQSIADLKADVAVRIRSRETARASAHSLERIVAFAERGMELPMPFEERRAFLEAMDLRLEVDGNEIEDVSGVLSRKLLSVMDALEANNAGAGDIDLPTMHIVNNPVRL